MKLLPVLMLVSVLATVWANEDDQKADPMEQEPTIQVKEGDGVHQFAVAIPSLQQTHYQAMHDSGRYSYGYAYPDQVHVESRSDDGTVSGSYYYTDPDGKQNQVAYKADETGFHVTANNLPVFAPGLLPEPVQDTPEVAEAKRQHLAIWKAIADQHAKSAAAAAQAAGQSGAAEPVNAENDPLQAQTKPIDVDLTVDDEKEAIITDRLTDQTGFEVDAEPIKILAQLYGKHLSNTARDRPEKIERPEGFYPAELRSPSSAPDIFRSVDDSDAAVVVTNPEFVDLRAFVLTNRFRSADEQSDAMEARSRPIDVEGDESVEKSESVVEERIEPAPERPVEDVAAVEPVPQPVDAQEKPAAEAVKVEPVPEVMPVEDSAKVEQVPEPVNVQATPEEPVQDVEKEAVVEPESPSKDAIVIQDSDPIDVPVPVPATNAADSVRIPIEPLDEAELPDPTRFDDGSVPTHLENEEDSVTVEQTDDSGTSEQSEVDNSLIIKELVKYFANAQQPTYYVRDYHTWPYSNPYYRYPSVSPYYMLHRSRPAYSYYPYMTPYYSPYQRYQHYSPYYYYY